MTIKNMAPYRRELKAGVPVSIEVGGEFVFIDQGEDLEIRVDGMIMPHRNAGDIMRLSGAFKRVTLTSAVDQVAIVIIGFGDYNRLIISGELNISPFVSTNRGVSSLLPTEIAKTVAVESAEQWEGEQEYYSFSHSQESEGVFWWRDSYYLVGLDGLRRFYIGEGTVKGPDTPATVETEFLPWANGAIAGADSPSATVGTISGASITSDGYIYFFCHGTIHVAHLAILRWFSLDEYECDSAESGWLGDAYENGRVRSVPITKGIGFYNGKYYGLRNASRNEDKHLVIFDVSLSPRPELITARITFESVNVGILNGWDDGDGYTRNTHIDTDGTIVFGMYLADDYWAYIAVSPGGERIPGIYDIGDPIEKYGGGAVSSNGNYFAFATPDSLTIIAFWLTSYGTISLRDIGAGDEGKIYYSLPEYVPLIPVENGKYELFGGIIGAVLGAISGRIITSYSDFNYLDYVTEVSLFNGRANVTRSSGTKSFAKSGLDDSYPVVLESDVKISVLPEFFDL
ncbi:hypothetical protein [Microbulbifer sp. VVAC002]|uniref:hypothetical protein n=1 Tax=Microbulbifer sp. VVAC002 TaxID=3243387 RepID=UPI00403917F6